MHFEHLLDKPELTSLQKAVAFYTWVWYNTLTLQGSYIGNTTASQAVKAGSTPVPCSKKKAAYKGGFSFWGNTGGSRTHLNATRTSVAGEGWTEPHNYFRKAKMQIDSRTLLQKKRPPVRVVFFNAIGSRTLLFFHYFGQFTDDYGV